MEKVPEVWTIGFEKNSADRIIGWYNPYPNLYEADILIINLESLDETVLTNIDKNQFYDLINKIYNKFLLGGTVIFILSDSKEVEIGGSEVPTSSREQLYDAKLTFKTPGIRYSNYDLLPIIFKTEKIDGKKIKVKNNSVFSQYLSQVNNFYLLLSNFQINPTMNNISPINDLTREIINHLRFSSNPKISLEVDYLGTDNSQNFISTISWLQIGGYWRSGEMVLLPKSSSSPDELISSILRIYGKTTPAETIPEWAYRTSLPGIDIIKKKLEHTESKLSNINTEISDLCESKRKLESYYNLLTARDDPLENIIFDTFKELGFNEIKKLRSKEKEDWVIEFKTIPEFIYGVIEVKGANAMTGMKDLRQCDGWVVDYLQDGKNAKGIFIPNQFRYKEYPESKVERSKFEDNQMKFAESRNICVLPSHVLFELLIKHWRKPISRNQIEKLIANANGLVCDLDE